MALTQQDYERLLQLRTTLRRFLHFSSQQAEAAGITATQHQLLLAVRGHPGPDPPTVGEIAEYLVLRHHSAVGLIDRAEAAGLVARLPERQAGRVVRVSLTELGERKLEQLTAVNLAELRQLAPAVRDLWPGLDPP